MHEGYNQFDPVLNTIVFKYEDNLFLNNKVIPNYKKKFISVGHVQSGPHARGCCVQI
jgi:hypothetical protein